MASTMEQICSTATITSTTSIKNTVSPASYPIRAIPYPNGSHSEEKMQQIVVYFGDSFFQQNKCYLINIQMLQNANYDLNYGIRLMNLNWDDISTNGIDLSQNSNYQFVKYISIPKIRNADINIDTIWYYAFTEDNIENTTIINAAIVKSEEELPRIDNAGTQLQNAKIRVSNLQSLQTSIDDGLICLNILYGEGDIESPALNSIAAQKTNLENIINNDQSTTEEKAAAELNLYGENGTADNPSEDSILYIYNTNITTLHELNNMFLNILNISQEDSDITVNFLNTQKTNIINTVLPNAENDIEIKLLQADERADKFCVDNITNPTYIYKYDSYGNIIKNNNGTYKNFQGMLFKSIHQLNDFDDTEPTLQPITRSFLVVPEISGYNCIYLYLKPIAEDANMIYTYPNNEHPAEIGRHIDVNDIEISYYYDVDTENNSNETLKLLNNLIDSTKMGTIENLAIWGRSEQMIYIDGQELHIGPSGYYELKDFDINSLYIANTVENDKYVVDIQYQKK